METSLGEQKPAPVLIIPGDGDRHFLSSVSQALGNEVFKWSL